MATSGLEPESSAPPKPAPIDTATIAREAVDTCADAAAAGAEKAAIQDVINGFVAKVTAEAVESAAAEESGKDSEQVAETKSKEATIASAIAAVKAAEARAEKASARANRSSDGVRIDDHRVYRVRGGPLCWTQSADSVTVTISVPTWVRKEHVVVRFRTGAIAVRVAFASVGDAHYEITQPLFGAIDEDGSMWMIDGAGAARKLTLELEKSRVRWWPRLFMGDDPADYVPVDESTNALPGAPPTAPDSPCSPQTESPQVASPPPPDHPPPPAEPASDITTSRDLDGEKPEETLETAVEGFLGDVVDSVSEASRPRRPGVFNRPQGVFNRSQGARRVGGSVGGPARRSTRSVLTPADLARLFEQYKTTVEENGLGAPQAALQMATFYQHGVGVEQNMGQAAKYYRFALEHGAIDAGAAFQLGMIYNSGTDGVEADPEQAVKFWRVSAALGNPVAMFNLGVMYMQGNGCDMDPIGGIQWFQQAHAINPELVPPTFSNAQLAERMAEAERRRREKLKEQLSPKEKAARREAAMRDIRMVAYVTAGVSALGIAAVIARHWWRNRL